ncbi:hypothetical protein IWQ60_010612 [Tieghemiomyces parasiticus]|uniref:Uncharacterized protein n=1 Tax=Tieghemiomyces parasiticus TaxID=78921 RepID=A0A9W7ZL79_9FUNG|nr:hypothetical protein IWQ60_010612 [Tieghemiomyces parasiticus]
MRSSAPCWLLLLGTLLAIAGIVLIIIGAIRSVHHVDNINGYGSHVYFNMTTMMIVGIVLLAVGVISQLIGCCLFCVRRKRSRRHGPMGGHVPVQATEPYGPDGTYPRNTMQSVY